MKRLNQEKKRLIIGIIAILLIITMVFSVIAPFVYGAPLLNQNNQISIEAEIGFDGNYKISKDTPFIIRLKNNSNKNFKGEIQIPVLINSYSDEYRIISKEVELPSSSSKYISFKSKIPYVQKEFEINIVDTKNNIIQSKKISAKASPPENKWIGTISDTNENLVYLNPVYFGIAGGNFSISDQFFNQENSLFVPTKSIFSSFMAIAIDNYNMDLLSEDWVNSIKDWVKDGNIIILNKDNNKGSVVNSFLESSQAVEKNQDYLGTYKDLLDDSEIEKNVYNSINFRKLGNGIIVTCDFDLLKVSKDSDVFYETFRLIYTDFNKSVENEIINTSKTKDFENNLSNYTGRMPNFNDNSINIIFCIIFLYAVFIGPILYIILKKKDKRDNALKIIPMISISITVIIYAMSFRSNYKKPIANIVSYSNLDLLSNNVYDSNISANIVAPYKGDLTIEFDNEINFEGGSSERYGYYNEDSGEDDKEKLVAEKLTLGDSTVFTRFNTLKWDRNYIDMSKDILFDGGIDFDIHVSENFFLEGTITNNTGYDFEDVVLGINRSCIKIDKFKNGSQIKLAEYENELLVYGVPEEQDISTILTDGMRDRNVDELNKDINREYALELRQDIVSHIFSNSGFYENDYIIDLVAFNSNQIIDDDVKVNGKIPSITTTNVFTSSKKISADDFVNKEIPYGLLKSSIENSKDASLENVNLIIDQYSNVNQIEVYDVSSVLQTEFYVPFDFKVKGFQISWNTFGGYNEIYNYSTSSWEPLYTSQYNQDIASNYIHNYNDMNNCIQIRTSGLSETKIETPQIKISFE